MTAFSPDNHPTEISDERATHIAYSEDVDRAASLLQSGVSVLIVCDKAVMQYLWLRIVQRANLEPQLLTAPADPPPTPGVPTLHRSLRERHLNELRKLMVESRDDNVVVIPHLDLLAGGHDRALQPETRDVVELLYGPGGREDTEQMVSTFNQVLLGFADPSLELPPLLAQRFGIRMTLSGVSPKVRLPQNRAEVPVAEALILRQEAEAFAEGFEPEQVYKHLAGMNPVRLRQAVRYAYALQKKSGGPGSVDRLQEILRQFKADTSSNFEIPDVRFSDIGGYEDVIKELKEALALMLDMNAPRYVRESVPRGFILNGPPGTGKTLLAKAIAAHMQGTVMIVSGPEVNGSYFGESEQRVRELFADARRSAPSVIVFDEFDAIAGRRSSRGDGGTRAGNAVVAQILTEMDGFRQDVPMLVVGTTNRLGDIDDALLRPSRFQQIRIGYPDEDARIAIIRSWVRRTRLDLPEELILPLSNQMSKQWSGDDIRSVFAKTAAEIFLDPKRDPPQRRKVEEVIGQVVGEMRRRKRDLSAAQKKGTR